MTKKTFGWKEWCSLPELNIPITKAKIDTGATTSCIHAFGVEETCIDDVKYVSWKFNPLEFDQSIIINCKSPIIDMRYVSDSGGHKTLRYVIKTNIIIGDFICNTEFTLFNRNNMKFKILIGRKALENDILVDVEKQYLMGQIYKLDLKRFYNI